MKAKRAGSGQSRKNSQCFTPRSKVVCGKVLELIAGYRSFPPVGPSSPWSFISVLVKWLQEMLENPLGDVPALAARGGVCESEMDALVHTHIDDLLGGIRE